MLGHDGGMAGSDRPYHHGHLAPALVGAAVERARRAGPDAVVVREVARDVGVSPSAAYRHFRDRDDLLSAVAQVAREELAAHLLEAIGRAPGSGDRRADALARLEACGRGYVHFARSASPLFRTAFTATRAPARPDEPDAAAILVGCLDDLVDVGLLDPDRRRDAAVIAWSVTHGLGSLLADGAIAALWRIPDDEALDAVIVAVRRALLGPDIGPAGPA